MSDFFLELFSEEIPHKLQINAREQLDKLIKNELDEKEIKFEKFSVFSTPKRISVVINNIATEQKTNSQEVKGPRVGCNEQALEGFLNSRSVSRDDLITKDTEKGQFYYVKLEEKTIYTSQILAEKLPLILKSINWKKSMRWSNYDCFWGRPLKSICCLFDGQILNFNYFHLNSSNITYVNGPLEDKEVKI